MNPLDLMLAWLPPNDAEPRPVMILATVDDGRPDARAVLLSEADAQGLHFHTDARSRKAVQLQAVPFACAVLTWPETGRQLVVRGPVSPSDDATAAAAYARRGPYLRLLAWANTPSTALLPPAGRRARWATVEAAATAGPPPTWAGYRLTPERLTFWEADEAGPSHRTEYRRSGDTWTTSHLPG